jgi:glycosyltransferase involved in cell wall biosynthesis
MHVTVAICTWNRADLLGQTLRQMRHLRIPEAVTWELLVVNNNCTDSTEEVVADHAAHLPIRQLLQHAQGLSHCRNLAIAEARSDLIHFTDDDVLVDEHWLAALVRASARHPAASAFGGPIRPWFPGEPDADLVAAYPALACGFCGLDHDRGEGPLATGQAVWGANMAFRRRLLRGLSFDPSIGPTPAPIGSDGKGLVMSVGGGDDDRFIRALHDRGDAVVWVPDMVVLHYVDPRRMTLEYLDSYYQRRGRETVRAEGSPRGATIRGVPRWVLRQWLDARLREQLNRVALRRRAALKWRRKASVLQGMILECRTSGGGND